MVKKIEHKGKNEIMKNSAGNDVDILDPVQHASPFFSFHYSYREISSDGGKTRIRSKEKSFENNTFKSEEFEGTLPGNVYFGLVGEMQKMFFNPFSALMKPFSMFLPFGSKDRKK